MLHARMLMYLDEVVRSGSIRKAAMKLNVASTAINRQIIALEEELGQPIFERMPRRLRLTATGEALIEHVRDTLRNYDKFQQRLDSLKGLQRGHIKLATTIGLGGGPMAKIANDYMERHRGVQFRIRALFADGIPNSVLSGEVDLGLGFNLQPNPGLRTVFQFDIPIGLVVRPDHELADKSIVRIGDAARFPIVLPEPNMSLRTHIDIALSRLAVVPTPILETNSIEMIKMMSRLSNAVAFMNPLDVGMERAEGLLCYLPLAETPGQTLNLVARTRGSIDPVTSGFVEYLRHRVTDLVAALQPAHREQKSTTPR